jgi:hypothetical protein
VAAGRIAEVDRLGALYPVANMSFGTDRRQEIIGAGYARRSEHLIASARIFLEEIQFWPAVMNLSDVLKVRRLQAFAEFRSNLLTWIEAMHTGDVQTQSGLRAEIAKANRALARSTTCARVGGWFTYLGLPVSLLDMALGTFFGLPITIAGFGVQTVADWEQRRYRWTAIGRDAKR